MKDLLSLFHKNTYMHTHSRLKTAVSIIHNNKLSDSRES